MAKSFDSAVRQILFDKLVEMGRLSSNPTDQTIQTINEIPEPDVLKLLKSVGVGPTIQKAGGGMMDINHMIRPIGMANGGDASKAELEGLLKSLKLSLMIAEGTSTPSFLGGGSSQQIKDLENKIREIQLMLGE